MPETHADSGTLNEATVRELATTMHIHLREDEVHHYVDELTTLMQRAEMLAEIPHEVTPTTHANPQLNVMRPDEVRDQLTREEALQNAPEVSEGMFKVTSISGGEQ